jgi:hypothetical protein
LLQGAVRRVLRDIHGHRIPPRWSSGGRPSSPCLEARSSSRPMPRPVLRSSTLEYAPGVCPTHGHAMFVRRVGASLPTAFTAPRNGGGGSIASSLGAPSLPNSGSTARWLPGFAYDLDVVLPPPPPPIHRAPTPTWRPAATKTSAGPSSRMVMSSEPGSPLPRMRGRWFPASEWQLKSRWGRIHHSRLAATTFVAEARQGWVGFALSGGLHGRNTDFNPDSP